MKLKQTRLCRAALMAALGATALQVQADQLVTSTATHAYVDIGQTAPFAQGFDGDTFAQATASSLTSLQGFNSNLGVLTGVNVSVTNAPGAPQTWLRTYSPERGALAVTASFSAGLRLLGAGGATLGSLAPVSLISYASGSDAGAYGDATVWTQNGLSIDLQSADLNGVVDLASLGTQVDSTLRVDRIDTSKTKGVIQAYLTDSTGAASYGSLQATASYSYLEHAAASLMFDNAADTEVTLDDNRLSSLVTLVAGGAEGTTTGLDFAALQGDIECLGDCDHFSFNATASLGQQAGSQADVGEVTLLDTLADYTASFRLWFADMAGVGASASQRRGYTEFTVHSLAATAPPQDPPADVPEPQSALLALAGLGLMAARNGMRRLRQR